MRISKSMLTIIFLTGLRTSACATNLLTNPNFDTSYDGWTKTMDGVEGISTAFEFWGYGRLPDGTMGFGGGGSLGLTAGVDGSASSVSASQCISVNQQPLNASVWVWPFVLGGPAAAKIFSFTTGDCSGAVSGTFSLTPTVPITTSVTWYLFEVSNLQLPAATASIRFEFAVSHAGDIQYSSDYDFDHALLEIVDPIFSSGFEQ